MLTLTGKIYRNAKIHTTGTGKKVVQFTIVDVFQFVAPNGELKEISTYYNCSYWKSESLADMLAKGMIVTVSGYCKAEPYEKDGEQKARSAFHVELFTIQSESQDQAGGQPSANGQEAVTGKSTKSGKAVKAGLATAPAAAAVPAGESDEELPF